MTIVVCYFPPPEAEVGNARTEDCMKLRSGNESTILLARLDFGSPLILVKAVAEAVVVVVVVAAAAAVGRCGEARLAPAKMREKRRKY